MKMHIATKLRSALLRVAASMLVAALPAGVFAAGDGQPDDNQENRPD